eukprot:IDg18181t1
MIEDHRLKLRQAESELKNAAKTFDEKRKREGTERGGMVKELRELRRVDDKREAEVRGLKLKVREVTRTKDDEMKKLKNLVEDKEKKIQLLEKRVKVATSKLGSSRESFSNMPGSASSSSLAESNSETSTDSGPRLRPSPRRPLPRSATVAGSSLPRSRYARNDGPNAEQNRSGSFPRLSTRLAARNGNHAARRATRPIDSSSSDSASLAPRRISRLQDTNATSAPRRASRLMDSPEPATRPSRRANRLVEARSNNSEITAARRASRLHNANSIDAELSVSHIAGDVMELNPSES